jgi:serine/threonine-protein kinase
MDFGIARFEDSSLTATGIVMGTVSYMAPEYIREGHASAQSDLFAVGVMLYECLTGRKPFAGDNTTTILFKIVSDTPPPLELEATQGISPSIRMVLDKALAKDPQQRFQTAEELAKALRACKDPTWTGALDEATSLLLRQQLQPALAAASPTLMERLPEPALTRGVPVAAPRFRWLYPVCAGAALLAGGGALLAFRSKAKPAEPPALAASAPAVPAPVTAPAPAPVPVVAAPIQALPAKPSAPAAPARPSVPAPAPARPQAAAAAPAPVPVPAPAAEPKEPEDPLKTIGKLIATDPRQAASVLKPLVQAQPAKVELQGNYLAALYRGRNPGEFARAFTRATANGVTVKAMLGVPAFRSAMADESRLQKTRPPSGVLPLEVMAKVLDGL